MKSVISTERIPIKLWLDDIDAGALEQARNLANLPFAFRHVAIMPDAHQGYGMPIGGVLATRGVVIPNAVGKDIGCGMCLCDTGLVEIAHSTLESIVVDIKARIPVGFKWHEEAQDISAVMSRARVDGYMAEVGAPVISEQYQRCKHQLGTLGGGNHFIEIQRGDNDQIYVMIHSGSRNIGSRVADHYNNVAVKLNARWYSTVPKSCQLAFLPMNTLEYKQYINEMDLCVDFARANRTDMMIMIEGIFQKHIPNLSFGDAIDVAHNYARMENHFGTNVMIHRKGATLATAGTIGIIPGSMGSRSYIVRGHGNRESFMSCSHGAGRNFSRKQARRDLDLKEQIAVMDVQDIIHDLNSVDQLDESRDAYKDIGAVMADQNDLVEIVTELTPMAVVKG